MPTIDITKSLQAGIRRDAMEMWRQEFPVFEKQQAVMLKMLPYVALRKATYVFKESVPFPTFWGYGESRRYRTFKDRQLQISLYPYQVAIPYSGWDKEDDQLQDTKTHVQMAVKRFFQLPDKMIAEYLNGTASLNPVLVTAYDGANVFSATDGDGAARFGVVGGNIVTGSGAGSVAAFINDLCAAQRRFLKFLDPAGIPIFSEDDVQYTKLHVVGPNEFNGVFQKASKSENIRSDTQSITAETNFLMGEFKYHLNPYLTNVNNYFVFVEHGYYRPFAYRAPGEVRQIFADMSNSDRARDVNEEVLFSDCRVGMGPFQPACGIKINNS